MRLSKGFVSGKLILSHIATKFGSQWLMVSAPARDDVVCPGQRVIRGSGLGVPDVQK